MPAPGWFSATTGRRVSTGRAPSAQGRLRSGVRPETADTRGAGLQPCMSLSLVLVRRQPDGRMRRRRRSEVGGCRAGFPACRFGGLSSPPKCPDVQGAWDVRDVLGTDSPKNRQARQPALQAHDWNQTFVETRTSGSFRRSRSGRRRAGPRRPAGCPPAIRLPVAALPHPPCPPLPITPSASTASAGERYGV